MKVREFIERLNSPERLDLEIGFSLSPFQTLDVLSIYTDEHRVGHGRLALPASAVWIDFGVKTREAE